MNEKERVIKNTKIMSDNIEDLENEKITLKEFCNKLIPYRLNDIGNYVKQPLMDKYVKLPFVRDFVPTVNEITANARKIEEETFLKNAVVIFNKSRRFGKGTDDEIKTDYIESYFIVESTKYFCPYNVELLWELLNK